MKENLQASNGGGNFKTEKYCKRNELTILQDSGITCWLDSIFFKTQKTGEILGILRTLKRWRKDRIRDSKEGKASEDG